MLNPIIIIPSLNPDDNLIEYCKELINTTGYTIVVVDDGSDKEHSYIFSELEKFDEVTLLKHYINMGKGRALKDAFNFCLNEYGTEKISGVITVDSDGQHSIKDVIRIAKELQDNDKNLILGVRDFDSENVPPKSKFGNKLTRFFFKILHGISLVDTQTGLRAIPAKLISNYLTISGEKFEYETNMLVETSNKNIDITEIQIETLYENRNEGTHFHPIKDSIAIYKVLFATFIKYSFASFSSFILDILLFQLLISLTAGFNVSSKIFFSTVLARVISSFYNYAINKNVVFEKKSSDIKTLISYFALVIVIMCCSAGLVYLGYELIGIPETIIKIVVDTCLFVLSYTIQRKVIFKD